MSTQSVEERVANLSISSDPIDDIKLLGKFVDLRTRANGAQSEEDLCSVLFDIPKAFNECQFDESSLLYCRKYLNTDFFLITQRIDEVFRQLGSILFTACIEKRSLGNGVNVLLTGIRGVGKSCLLRMLYICSKLLFVEELVCIYQDFEEGVVRPLHKLNSLLCKEFKTIDDCINRTKQTILFFADEIDRLYLEDVDEDFDGLKCIRDLYALGKGSAAAFISGSSSKTAAYAFKRTSKFGVDPLRFHRYPNLNHTVYTDYRLLPLRTKEELHQFLLLRGDGSKDVHKVFFLSGGVPRAITKVVHRIRNGVPLAATDTEKKDLQDYLEKNFDLLVVFTNLAKQLQNLNTGEPEQWQEVWKIPTTGVAHLVHCLGDEKANALVYQWMEDGYIYKDMDNGLQFVYPWHGYHIKETRHNTDMSHAEWLCAYVILSKPGDQRQGDVFGDYIARSLIVGKHLIPIDSNQSIHYVPETIKSSSELKPEDLLFKFRKEANETGIDGFVVVPSEKPNVFHVHCVQIKTGHRADKHSKSQKSKTCGMTIPNIVEKFKLGSVKLLKRIQTAFPNDATIVLKSFGLFSTKELVKGGLELLQTTVAECSNSVVDAYYCDLYSYLPKPLLDRVSPSS